MKKLLIVPLVLVVLVLLAVWLHEPPPAIASPSPVQIPDGKLIWLDPQYGEPYPLGTTTSGEDPQGITDFDGAGKWVFETTDDNYVRQDSYGWWHQIVFYADGTYEQMIHRPMGGGMGPPGPPWRWVTYRRGTYWTSPG